MEAPPAEAAKEEEQQGAAAEAQAPVPLPPPLAAARPTPGVLPGFELVLNPDLEVKRVPPLYVLPLFLSFSRSLPTLTNCSALFLSFPPLIPIAGGRGGVFVGLRVGLRIVSIFFIVKNRTVETNREIGEKWRSWSRSKKKQREKISTLLIHSFPPRSFAFFTSFPLVFSHSPWRCHVAAAPERQEGGEYRSPLPERGEQQGDE